MVTRVVIRVIKISPASNKRDRLTERCKRLRH
jgi:hypothetical protein